MWALRAIQNLVPAIERRKELERRVSRVWPVHMNVKRLDLVALSQSDSWFRSLFRLRPDHFIELEQILHMPDMFVTKNRLVVDKRTALLVFLGRLGTKGSYTHLGTTLSMAPARLCHICNTFVHWLHGTWHHKVTVGLLVD